MHMPTLDALGASCNPSLVAWGGASDRDAGPLRHARVACRRWRRPPSRGALGMPWRGRGRQPRVMGALGG